MARRFLTPRRRLSAAGRPPWRIRWATALAALLIAAIGAGCSTRQVYDSAQGWQRNACARVVDSIERERCFASTATSYDDYRRQRQAPDEPVK